MNLRRWGSIALVMLEVSLVGVGGAAAVGIGPFAPTECPAYVLSIFDYSSWTPESPVVPYETLTEYQQDRFRVSVEVDGASVPLNETQWANGADAPQYINYRNSTYHATYYGTECNVFQEIYRMGGPALMLVGVALVMGGSRLKRPSS
ncbi:hypothetical protein [Halomarina litorea]|uniref:hypothetical protein n=1 Tax=Halomarina litorea TaxID=2961595 RepID=UPI0020C420A7|nr:hypothetical protein [Halomarina sp. BCD28]